MKDVLDLVGRIFLSSIFLLAAYEYITDFEEVRSNMIQEGVVWRPNLLLRGSIFALTFGGLSVLFGYRPKLGAALLLAFMLPVTIIFYTDNLSDELEQTMLMKNIAIIGGLMVLLVNGSGRYSVRKLLASTKT